MSALETYIGTKIIQAMPHQHADGRDGYQVVYEDGYTSWSPKDVFEKAYREIVLPDNFASLQPHQQRVVMEKADLDARLAKLIAFIDTMTFKGLDSVDEQDCLMHQVQCMKDYSEVLGERIGAWFGARA